MPVISLRLNLIIVFTGYFQRLLLLPGAIFHQSIFIFDNDAEAFAVRNATTIGDYLQDTAWGHSPAKEITFSLLKGNKGGEIGRVL